MAVRHEDLVVEGAQVVEFPVRIARARAAAARRRLAVRRGLVALLVVATTSGIVWASAAGRPAVSSRGDAPASVVVRPGETLWGIAERWAPEGTDLRAYVDALARENGVAGGVLEAGARVVLPD